MDENKDKFSPFYISHDLSYDNSNVDSDNLGPVIEKYRTNYFIHYLDYGTLIGYKYNQNRDEIEKKYRNLSLPLPKNMVQDEIIIPNDSGVFKLLNAYKPKRFKNLNENMYKKDMLEILDRCLNKIKEELRTTIFE